MSQSIEEFLKGQFAVVYPPPTCMLTVSKLLVKLNALGVRSASGTRLQDSLDFYYAHLRHGMGLRVLDSGTLLIAHNVTSGVFLGDIDLEDLAPVKKEELSISLQEE